MISAGEALLAAAIQRLRSVKGLTGVHERAPVQAAFPHATVEVGPEVGWGHKTGLGRELRLAVIVRDKGERPERLRRLMDAAEAAVGEVEPLPEGWQIVTLNFLRSRTVRDGTSWAGVLDFRARMLAAPD
ncbi:DUF3168 domain-containing protein [Sphingosinicella sp. LHD-64]|uniref:tail completion protein gp17 n=1 Tax=Sphingosinicella sp. LHD-64 TaxID=3072139 RepID=UPI00280CB792|nr:DUF3168 domain-containing protein [Sphingosinicella sp. LHD-64]MDQ8757845.1 DUF3168 domain-containing protein [Sphingosinicella sp. LHD-64]